MVVRSDTDNPLNSIRRRPTVWRRRSTIERSACTQVAIEQPHRRSYSFLVVALAITENITGEDAPSAERSGHGDDGRDR